ncbi:ExeA family protein [Colwellia hornerae]|uniref:AAA family ATPase n=1 Tax=Colwellia hornerae TaxID=89402 RepID=A0A5C6Q6N7_9GAMM|nr:AAA family ATPase [Colwellia hornerae]TWX49201.1 AAA family ATPase [Colwellia hornerae]TWX55628.1 AAA family ATPase [Colwellia hornerae]TWX64644.1 AAA family ATPase [Colwellia hornerae]
MYLYHFGLTELPFTLTPNTAFYVGLEPHNEALAVLLTALKTGEGFIKVIGEVGTGKTLLCRKLLNEIPEHFVTAYIPNPYLKPDELRRAVAVELGIKQAQRMSVQLLTQRIQQRLLELHSAGHSVVLILDEAQALPEESLEALRLFTNLETETRKLLQVVLFAQPELDERLATTRFRQLKQRITFSYKLRAMTTLEVQGYIQHRMQVAGYKGATLFSAAISKKVAKVSLGIPRLVNVLCHKMLMLSYGQGQYQITNKHLSAAIEDTEATTQTSNVKGSLSLAALVISAVLIVYVLKNYGVIA